MDDVKAKAARAELRLAIEAEALARQHLQDAQTAGQRASNNVYATLGKIDAVNLEIADAQADDDSMISAIAAGGDLATMAKPVATLRARLTELEAEADAWRDARRRAEEAVEARRSAVDLAQRRLNRAVAGVVESETDISGLLSEATKLQAQVLACRARLAALSGVLDDGHARQRVRDFLSHGWLAEFAGEQWQARPEAAEVKAWAEALRRDAQTPALPL